jgi:hypothetical protein
MYSSTDENSFLFREYSRFILKWKQHLVVNMFLLFGDLSCRTDRYQFNRTILIGQCQGCSVEIHIANPFGCELQAC